MTERLQEILNRKPSKWGNLTVKEFEGDIKLLQESVEELERENEKVRGGNFGLSKIINSKRKEINRLKQVLEFYANEKNYERAYDDEVLFDYLPSEIDFDNGEKARKALESESK